MKKALVVIAGLIVLVAAAVLALPALVPAERIKNEAAAAVKAATGRDLTIAGDVDVSVFPALAVQVADVALANPPGFAAKDMLRLKSLDIQLRLFPLLSGRVEVDAFVLTAPVVALEIDRKGRANWVFETGAEAGTASRPAGGTAGGGAPADIRLGDVRIVDGRVSYADARSGLHEEVDGVDLALRLDSLDQPLSADGGLNWRGKPVRVALNVVRPRAVIEGGTSPVDASVAAEAVTLAFKGEATGGAKAGAAGAVDLSVPSLRALAAWTGNPLAMPGGGFGPLSIKGKLVAAGPRVAFTEAAIAFDAIRATGDLSVDTGGARPRLAGKLAVEALDLNPYLPPEEAGTPGAASGHAQPADWSDEPIDASALKSADADFNLTAQSIRMRKIEVGRSVLRLRLANGRLNADLDELALYQGVGKGRLVLDGSGSGLGLDAALSLNGVQAAPLLSAAADFDRLEGTANADLQAAGRGRSQREIVASLAGKGSVAFLDGAIRGINLAAMVRNVTTAFADVSGAQKTDFAELSGSYSIAKGIVSNRDLSLKSPLLRVAGAGTVDLPRRTLSYRVEPKAVASLEGQGGQADLAGIMVPVIVEGPWSNLSYRPDLAGAMQSGIGKAVERAVGGKLPALPGTGQATEGAAGAAPASPSPLPLPIDPSKLFGR